MRIFQFKNKKLKAHDLTLSCMSQMWTKEGRTRGEEKKKKTKPESKHDVIAASHKQFKGHWLSAVLHSFPIDVSVMAIKDSAYQNFYFSSTSLMRNFVSGVYIHTWLTCLFLFCLVLNIKMMFKW